MIRIFAAVCLLIASSMPFAIARAESYDVSSLRAMVVDAAARHGVSAAWMLAVVDCETGQTWNPYAVGQRGDYGLFQFVYPGGIWSMTWYGRNGIAPWQVDVWTQVDQAVALFAAGYGYHWSCR